jgi:hypothetical protein
MMRGGRRQGNHFAAGQGHGCDVWNASGANFLDRGGPVAFETEAVIVLEPETADLVPSEASSSPIIEPVSASSFPKVLRRRLDGFFAD